MYKSLLFIPLLTTLALAKAPIEGGKDSPLSSFEYVDIIRLEASNQSQCTATRVSPTMVLTAGHCVGYFAGDTFMWTIRAGMFLPSLGLVVKVSLHPKYQEAYKKKLTHRQDKVASKLSTLYDIAFIELEEKKTSRTLPYPKIISSQDKPTERKKVELAGFGNQEAFWDGDQFSSRSKTSVQQIADNEWIDCPVDYQNKSLTELENLTNSITEHLAIRARRVHNIINSNEEIVTDGRGMILSGDSGSPALERAQDNSLIITGVASNIITFDDDSGDPKLEISLDGKTVVTKDFESMPSDWGLRTKTDSEFPEISSVLKEKNLLTADGKVKEGVQIKRSYVRYTKGHFADLSHPENQSFIKSVMK